MRYGAVRCDAMRCDSRGHGGFFAETALLSAARIEVSSYVSLSAGWVASRWDDLMPAFGRLFGGGHTRALRYKNGPAFQACMSYYVSTADQKGWEFRQAICSTPSGLQSGPIVALVTHKVNVSRRFTAPTPDRDEIGGVLQSSKFFLGVHPVIFWEFVTVYPTQLRDTINSVSLPALFCVDSYDTFTVHRGPSSTAFSSAC